MGGELGGGRSVKVTEDWNLAPGILYNGYGLRTSEKDESIEVANGLTHSRKDS